MKTGGHMFFRRAARYFLAAIAVQMLLLLLATPEGLSWVYPLAARAASVKVTTGDNSYTDYFALREPLAEADVVVLGVDFSVEETYTLLTDLLASMKNERNIGTVFVDYPPRAVNAVSDVISALTEEKKEIALDEFRDEAAAVRAFLERLRAMNDNYPPRRKYAGGTVAVSADESYDAALQRAAADACRATGRPVLVVTDAKKLDAASDFLLSAGRFPGRWMYVQCRYEEKSGVFGAPSYSLALVDSEQLAWFDDLYAAAARPIGGRYSPVRYSETYSTPKYFWMINGTRLASHAAKET